MNMLDHMNTSKLKGTFLLNIKDRDGTIIKAISEPNLIVNGSKSILAALVGGVGQPISKIGVGTGTIAADLTDTGLTDPYYKNIVSVTYPSSPEWAQFNWYLAYDELVDVTISEFGLFTAANLLFSRKVYTPIPKSADMAFEGQWTIKFFQE